MSTTMTGDIWDVPQVLPHEFDSIPADVWREAESLLGGYDWKCRDACHLERRPWGPGWLDAITGLTAIELGAPVGNALRVVLLRRRAPCPRCEGYGTFTDRHGTQLCDCPAGRAILDSGNETSPPTRAPGEDA